VLQDGFGPAKLLISPTSLDTAYTDIEITAIDRKTKDITIIFFLLSLKMFLGKDITLLSTKLSLVLL
jgi:hypothetical protein